MRKLIAVVLLGLLSTPLLAAECSTTIEGSGKPGKLVEVADTNTLFTNPRDSRTEAYVTGRFG